jgi:hypothetical protein
LENFSSFGFAKGRLVCRAKPNVLKCAAGKKKLKMRVGKNFKNIAVGMSVGKVGMCQDEKELSAVSKSAYFLVAKSPDF